MSPIVVSEFQGMERGGPLLRVGGAVDGEVCFNFLIYSFRGSVCLWMIHCRQCRVYFINSRNAFDANCGPLSEIILSGNPNRLYKFSSKSLAVPLDVIVLLQGMSITKALIDYNQDGVEPF